MSRSGEPVSGRGAGFAAHEPIALTIPQESGSGGTAAWRAAEVENTEAPQGCENPNDLTRCVQKLSSTYTETQWFGTAIAQFSNAVDPLPVDHHELIGLGAPRGMLALGNIGWRWLGRYGSVQGMSAAREVYRALGAAQSIGFVESSHFHCNNMDFAGREQAAVDAYVAKFLLDQEVSTDFWDEGVAFDTARWVNWQTPTLQWRGQHARRGLGSRRARSCLGQRCAETGGAYRLRALRPVSPNLSSWTDETTALTRGVVSPRWARRDTLIHRWCNLSFPFCPCANGPTTTRCRVSTSTVIERKKKCLPFCMTRSLAGSLLSSMPG